MNPEKRRRSPNRAASIRARLLTKAKAADEDFSVVLNRFAVERWLYRLSVSPVRDRFVLKGALLFGLWFDEPHRPTRDADFLGVGTEDAPSLEKAVRTVCEIDADDGLAYNLDSIRTEPIREDSSYGGLRVRLSASLGDAVCSVQLDVGFGDAVTPRPEEIAFPSALDDLPAFKLTAYPRESVVAEKLEALVSLGMANSRMKDYFDLRALAKEGAVDRKSLIKAITATFKRRKTRLPEGLPVGLTGEFGNNTEKQKQWLAFLRRNRLREVSLATAITDIRNFLEQPLTRARIGRNGK